MVIELYRKATFLGVTKNDMDSISQIKLINSVSIMVAGLMIVQLPLIVLFWRYSGTLVLWLNLSHAALFCVVPLFNHRGHFHSARTLLTLSYISYLALSSIAWQHNLQFHYFFLIALFVSPYLYRRWEVNLMLPNVFIYLFCFCLLDWYWINKGTGHVGLEQQPYLSMLSHIILLISACISSLLIYKNGQRNRDKFAQRNTQLSQILNKTLPTALARRVSHNPNFELFSHKYTRHQATVLFADLHNYTQFCHHTSEEALIEILNEFYSELDEISRRFGIEKIKTNGDQYMATCGVLESQNNTSVQCCLAALAMLDSCRELSLKSEQSIKVRIGIASGELISGFVGEQSCYFDVWGDTVNLASRMESTGVPGKIQVSQQVFNETKACFTYTPRGMIKMKGLGTLPAYLLSEYEGPQYNATSRDNLRA